MINVPFRFMLLCAGVFAVGLTASAIAGDTVVQITLNGQVNGIFGPINNYQVQLFDSQAPITVANFLLYVNNGKYSSTIIHRDVQDFVMQGGGFKETVNSQGVVTSLDPIATYGPIQNEFSPTRSNIRGTIAMAKLGGDPNSATSQWFVNISDNSGNLDYQNGGFTVFGNVVGEGMKLVDGVDGLPTANFNPQYYPSDPVNGPFAQVPYFEVKNPDGSVSRYFIVVMSATVVPTTAWKGGSTFGAADWSITANWETGAVPDGAGVSLNVGSQSAANNMLDMVSVGRTVGNIYFSAATSTTIKSTGNFNLTLNNNGSRSLISVLGNHTISAPVVLANNVLISGFTGAETLTLSGPISGTGALAEYNMGSITLAGNNTFTGPIYLYGGILKAASLSNLGGGSALNFNGGVLQFGGVYDPSVKTMNFQEDGATLDTQTNNIILEHDIGNGGAGGLIKAGAGSLTLLGNNSYSGNTIVDNGILEAGKAASLPGYNTPGKVVVDPGSTLAVRAGAASGQWAAAEIDALRTNVAFGSGAYLGIDTISDDFTYSSAISGAIGLTKLGAKTLTLTGNNTFTGAVNFNAGLVKAAALSNLGAGAVLNFNGGGLQFGGVYDPSARTMSFQPGGATLDTQGNSIILNHAIGGGGAGGLTKVGAGVLVLNGANTFTGPVNLDEGTIKAAALDNLGGGSALNFNGGTLQFNGVFDPSVRTITFQTNGAVLDTLANTITIAHAIGNGGPGGLTKEGAGTLILSASPNYSGLTAIGGGTIQLGTGATLPAATALSLMGSGTKLDINGNSQTIASLSGLTGSEVKLGGGSLTVANSTPTMYQGSITSASGGSLIKTGAGSLELNGPLSYSGATVINGGLLNINNNLSTTLGTISGTGSLSVNGASTVLTAASINVGQLTVGPGSIVNIKALAGSDSGFEESGLKPIPEPGVLALLGMAALAVVFATWRKMA
jgi:fibronectin-binding autotransporter adhesin